MYSINRISFILLILIPISLSTGPFFPDFFLSLIGLLFVTNIFLYNKQLLSKEFNYFNKIFILFIAWIFLSSVFSNNILLSFENSLFYFRYFFFYLSIHYFLLDEKKENIFLISIISTLIFINIDALFQKILGFNFFGIESYNNKRLSGIFGDESILGKFNLYLIPYFFIFFETTKLNKLKKIVIIISIFLSFYIAVLSGERSALLKIIIFLLLYFLFFYPRKLIFLSLIFIFISLLNFERIYKDTFSELYYGEKLNLIPEHHSLHYRSAILMGNDNPIFGVGPKLFRVECDNDAYEPVYESRYSHCSTHPHNLYLQLYAETGFIGLTFLLFFYLYLIMLGFKYYTKKNKVLETIDKKTILIVIALLSYLFPLLPSQSFFNNWVSVFYFLMISYLYSCQKRLNIF